MKKQLLILVSMLMPLMASAYDFEMDGIFYNITSIEDKTVEVTYSTELNYQQNYVVIPAEVSWNGYTFTVKGIGADAFDSGNFPNNVDTIIISKGLEYIGRLAFQCQRLKLIRIPNTIKTIEYDSFAPGNERNISTDWYVDDYEWLCTIGYSFYYPRVKNIYIDNVKLDGDFIIPEGVPHITSSFSRCGWIKSLTVPSSVSYINGSFWECTNLESVEIMEGVKNVNGQFYGCTKLKTVKLPNSLESIGWGVFDNCPALVDIQSYITNPFPVNSFTNGQYLSATLTVPHGTKAKYRNTEGWKNFVNIIEDGNNNPLPQKCDLPYISYTKGKLAFGCSTENVEFVYEINNEQTKKGIGTEIDLLPPLTTITVFAKKDGYDDSDVATATIGWRNGTPVMEGFSSIDLGKADNSCDVNGDGAVDVADIATIISEMAARARMQK